MPRSSRTGSCSTGSTGPDGRSSRFPDSEKTKKPKQDASASFHGQTGPASGELFPEQGGEGIVVLLFVGQDLLEEEAGGRISFCVGLLDDPLIEIDGLFFGPRV